MPPGGKPERIRTGRTGQLCADATREAAGSATMPPAHFKTSRRGNFTSSLLQMPAANGGSFGFDVGELVDLRPLLGFVGDEFAEVGGRAGKHAAAEIVEALAHLGIVKRGIDLFVEVGDDGG